MSRIIVCGGRDYCDAKRINVVLHEHVGVDDVIITGAARGADLLAERWARMNQLDYCGYPARWSREGKRAGPARNLRMLVESRADLVIAMPGGTGTAHMIGVAEDLDVPVLRLS